MKKGCIKGFIITLLIFSALVLIFVYGFCDYIPKKTVTSNIKKYGKYDKYVNEKLDKNFHGSLPEKIPDDCSVIDYNYYYNSPLLEFPIFYINLELEFDKTRFAWEYERIKGLKDALILSSDELSFVVLDGYDYIEECLDDDFQDGCWEYFEIVEFDTNNNRVEYHIAVVTDASVDFALDFIDVLKTISEIKPEQ